MRLLLLVLCFGGMILSAHAEPTSRPVSQPVAASQPVPLPPNTMEDTKGDTAKNPKAAGDAKGDTIKKPKVAGDAKNETSKKIDGAIQDILEQTKMSPACAIYSGNVCLLETKFLEWNFARVRLSRFPPQYQKQIKKNFLGFLIRQQLFALEASRQGIQLKPGEVQELIGKTRLFYDGVTFSKKKYDDTLKDWKIQDSDLRVWLGAMILSSHLMKKVAEAAIPSKEEAWKAFQRDWFKLELETLRFDLQRLPQIAKPEGDELKRFLVEHDAALREMYKEITQRAQGKQIRARHILLRLDPNADKKSAAEVYQKMEKIRQEALASPKRFSDLARQHSTCPSRAQGGDLGFFPRGAMVPAFDQAAFALQKIGAISSIVRTQFGLHIIKLIGQKGGPSGSFEDARLELGKLYFDKLSRAYLQQVLELQGLPWVLGVWKSLGRDPLPTLRSVAPNPTAQPTPSQPAQLVRDLVLSTLGDLKNPEATVVISTMPRHPLLQSNDALRREVLALHEKNPWISKPYLVGSHYYLVRLVRRIGPNKEEFAREGKEILKNMKRGAQQKALEGTEKTLRAKNSLRYNKPVMLQLGLD